MTTDELKAKGFQIQPDGSYRKPVAGLGSAKPKHNLPCALDYYPPEQKGRVKGAGKVHIFIVRFGHRLLDDDNLVFAHKALRDGIATVISLDDGDPRIEWHYEQIQTKAFKGTHVLISLLVRP